MTSMVGLEREENSSGLKLIFILTIICFAVEMFALTYRFSFFTILGLVLLLYILFLGYYTDKSVVYLIVYFIFSILFDLGFGYLDLFTEWILNPVIFTYNTFLKYIAMAAILLSIVCRVVIIIKLLSYR